MAHFNYRDRWTVELKEHIKPGSQRGWKEAGKIHSRRTPTDADLMALARSPVTAHTRGRKTTSDKYKHVYRDKQRWQSTFKYHGDVHYIGRFDDEDTAARMHDLYIIANDLPDFLLIGVDLDAGADMEQAS